MSVDYNKLEKLAIESMGEPRYRSLLKSFGAKDMSELYPKIERDGFRTPHDYGDAKIRGVNCSLGNYSERRARKATQRVLEQIF